MYRTNWNNYYQNPKPSNIYTPLEVSQFMFDLLNEKIDKRKNILDPCSGMGSLGNPWKEGDYNVLEFDIDPNSTALYKSDFLKEGGKGSSFDIPEGFSYGEETREYFNIGLVLCNPPFNGYGNKLASEVWLDKIIELFGKEIPLVLFVPVGFRLNLTPQSERYRKFAVGIYPAISSFIALPKNIFPNVTFHSEILIFNIKGLEPHYFYHEPK